MPSPASFHSPSSANGVRGIPYTGFGGEGKPKSTFLIQMDLIGVSFNQKVLISHLGNNKVFENRTRIGRVIPHLLLALWCFDRATALP